MSTKKIWVLAIIFGLIMSILFFIVISYNGSTNQVATATSLESEEVEETEEEIPQTIEIAEGKRAISIAVNEVQSVSGFVRPGSFVDLVTVLPLPAGEESTSQILLNNVKVLAVGKTFVDEYSENLDSYQMVTLEVSPEDGAALAFAQETGVSTLMLRGEEDSELSPRVNISLEQLKKGKMSK
ncbi:Flp pilus assembly protein CpaB [Halalkalibacter alkaliphilus]|uniref:Flp pilus assembly protein CpaB n=1 Tax=Halalkalibacter alkaliphilus TaxID=2917993 RepID=A0A9X2CRP4_9BACI|nr:Flp pilus assembly protein CpaB [Halalkalibacter alkaliphilus]MCL7746729.1 Flp pilus assembly protein CpaB [Halalkalibacter alkaliphilus]